jgi:hypothetical protein
MCAPRRDGAALLAEGGKQKDQEDQEDQEDLRDQTERLSPLAPRGRPVPFHGLAAGALSGPPTLPDLLIFLFFPLL